MSPCAFAIIVFSLRHELYHLQQITIPTCNVTRLQLLFFFTGALKSMRHFKKEVDTIKTDSECGLTFVDETLEPQQDDTVICYELKEEKQTLHWSLEF